MPRDKQDRSPAWRCRAAPNGASAVPSDDQSTVHLGRRLRQCRDSSGLTQAQAAAAAGITRNALGRLEGKQFPNPCLQTLLALMQVYRLHSLEELLGPFLSQQLAKEWAQAGWAGTRHEGSATPTN
ncbi:MAG: helix-turn-helix domain-containing protein [Pseudonocardiaceae bacterium]